MTHNLQLMLIYVLIRSIFEH